ncbi:MAG: AlpA family phage regulatory protein [Gammaproteobacteria bacterium]|nr:AlpA family phage regulatory protein [Gammaproteobacteria bacterium]
MANLQSLTHIQPALLRVRDLMAYLNFGRTGIYKLVKEDPTFPRSIQLSNRAVAWKREEIDRWIDSRPLSVASAEARERAAIDAAKAVNGAAADQSEAAKAAEGK